MKDKQKTAELIRIAGPAVLESVVTVVITTIDTKMISGLGKPAISAVALTTQPKLIIFAIFFALGTTASILVAQAYGRNDREEANLYLHTILKLTIILSVILGALMYVLAEPVMLLCNRQEESLEMSVVFFRIIMLFLIFQVVSIVINAALRGIGKTKITLISSIVMGVTDIIFNYFLIEGRCGFPRLEVAGDAIATVLGSAAACIIGLAALSRKSLFLSMKGFIHGSILKNRERLNTIISKAGNVVVENILMKLGFLFSSIILSGLGADETAVYSVAMLLMNYSFAMGDGIHSAMVALTGKNTGAGDHAGMKKYVSIAVRIGAVCSFILSLVYILGAGWFYGLYFSDAPAIHDGIMMTYIVALITFLQIVRMVFVGAMRGMGDVKDPRNISTICVFLLNPSMSYLFSQVIMFGIWGIWIASVITQAAWFVMAAILYKKQLHTVPASKNI